MVVVTNCHDTRDSVTFIVLVFLFDNLLLVVSWVEFEALSP